MTELALRQVSGWRPNYKISDSSIDDIVRQMENTGFGVIADYITETELARMRGFVNSAIQAAGMQYVGFVGEGAVSGTVFAEISQDEEFRGLMRRIYERGVEHPAPDPIRHHVLRCLAGETGLPHSLIFHYDSYIVTALIPVEIPLEGRSGDLIMLRYRRSVRRSYIANLIDKILVDNKLSQLIFRLMFKLNILPVIKVKMIPGNIYLFWGYRTIHANEACSPDSVRATAIYHLANPHAGSSLRAAVRKILPR